MVKLRRHALHAPDVARVVRTDVEHEQGVNGRPAAGLGVPPQVDGVVPGGVSNRAAARLYRREALGENSGGSALSPQVAGRIRARQGSGSALPSGTRTAMEQAFGSGFGDVVVHSDSEADALSREVHAMAFTAGVDVFFRRGAYQPGSSQGRALLAHELTHVLQQRAALPRSPGRDISLRSDAAEVEAAKTADAVARRSTARPVSQASQASSAAFLQRTPADKLIGRGWSITATERAIIDDELVPMGEAPGHFDGFPRALEAMRLAERAAQVTLVVSDSDGRFHVLRATATSLGKKSSVPENPIGWRIHRIIDPSRQEGDAGRIRQEDPDRANERADRAEEPEEYKALLSEWSHLAPDEIACPSGPRAVVAGRVNIAPWLESRGQTQPHTFNPTGDSPLTQPAILISTARFSMGPTAVRATLLHELRHAYQLTQTIDLVHQWRKGRAEDTIDSWRVWLDSQQGRLSDEVYLTAQAATGLASSATATPEVYAYTAAFVYMYNRLNLAFHDPEHLTDDESGVLRAMLSTLHSLGKYWQRADEIAQEETMNELREFLNSLTPNHRKNVRYYIDKQSHSRAPEVFYQELDSQMAGE